MRESKKSEGGGLLKPPPDRIGLSWENVSGICTDGAPAMLGSRFRFLKLAKKHNPNIVGIHWMIHRQALASKTLSDPLRVHLQTVINILYLS